MTLLAHLRQNARVSLKELSRKTGMPVSTIFDKMQQHKKQQIITKNSILFDFQKIGYSARATMLLRVYQEERQKIAEYLQKNINVNSIYKINNGYDFLVECVFKNIQELEQFSELLETKFRIKTKETHYIIEDIKREGFMADPELAKQLETLPSAISQ